jgi:hypothetical protein
MTSEKPQDDNLFISSTSHQTGRYGKPGVKTYMIDPVSSATAVSQALPTHNTAQAKPQPPSSSEPQDTVQLSAKAQAQSSGDVDHDGDSH